MIRHANGADLNSRAVIRLTEPGTTMPCTGCGADVKFIAKKKGQRVIANVYENGVWNRVEHWHSDCYREAGEPYGEAVFALRVNRLPVAGQ